MKATDDVSIGLSDLPLHTFVPRRYQPGGIGTWSGHLAFANDLIKTTKPTLIVELGTHWGESYFTFCQSVADNGLTSLCYAIDHWLGDAHSGTYGEEVIQDVSSHNSRFYGMFSYLLRANFDDAIDQFEDASIGLLHLDGLHTYEAGSHDFRSWLPKVKPGGIVLLHDICARHSDFGVWRLWSDIKSEFRDVFEFHHSWGLGVVRKEGGAQDCTFTNLLFTSGPAAQERIRRSYALYASHLENLLLPRTAQIASSTEISGRGKKPTATVKVYPFGREGYSEVNCTSENIEVGDWTTIDFELASGLGSGPLRIDPAEFPCVVEVNAVALYSESGSLLFGSKGADVRSAFSVCGTATVFMHEDRFLLFSYGSDPQFVLSSLPLDHSGCRLELTLKIDLLDVASGAVNLLIQSARATAELEVSALRTALSASNESRQALEGESSRLASKLNELAQTSHAVESDMSVLRCDLSVSHSERLLVEAELSRIATERNDLRGELGRIVTERNDLRSELSRVTTERNDLRDELTRTKEVLSGTITDFEFTRKSLESESKIRYEMLHSKSWRLTEPMRRFMLFLRSITDKSV